VATVSRVINNRPDVAPETRADVLRAVRAHNFATNRTARALVIGRTGLIGLTVPYVDESYFTAILSGAAEALYEQGQRAVLCPTRHEQEREATLLARLTDGATDGAIVLLPNESSEGLRRLQRTGYPFVVADLRYPLDPDIPAVTATNLAGGKVATDHLLRLAHRRIGLISGVPGWTATEERREGYRIALASAGCPIDGDLIVEGDFTTESGYSAARRLLRLPLPPTGIVASNDNMAAGALRAAVENGLRVPHDLSIVGFDDTPLAHDVVPRLTTVRQPLAELGRTAVSLLNRLIEGQSTETLRVELATRLILRESTSRPRD
jgi:LacI family transcriptional regulator, galactose operon repressor